MDVKDQQRKTLEEAIRLLESVRGTYQEHGDFDDARLNSHLVTALTAARAALNIARGVSADTPDSAL